MINCDFKTAKLGFESLERLAVMESLDGRDEFTEEVLEINTNAKISQSGA